MRRLFKVFLRSVVLVALGSIQAPVEIGLPIVSDIEDIKVIVLKIVFSSAIIPSFSWTREPKGFDQKGRYKLDLTNTPLLPSTLQHLSVIHTPSIVLANVSVRPESDYGSTRPLVLLDHDVVKGLILKFRGYLNQVEAVFLSKGDSRLVVLILIQLCVLDHLVELAQLLIILLLGLFVESRVLSELLIVVISHVLFQVKSWLSLEVSLTLILIAYIFEQLLLFQGLLSGFLLMCFQSFEVLDLLMHPTEILVNLSFSHLLHLLGPDNE